MKKRLIFITLLVLLSIAAGMLLNLWTSRHEASKLTAQPGIEGLLWPNPRTLAPFTLIDQLGKAFGLEQMSGKWSFLFFGYTHCPDACPITLTVLKQFYEKLVAENAAGDVQVIFVTVDPARDTPQQMADYVRYFNDKFIGLTGTGAQIAALTQQMGVVFRKADDREDYAVDHSAAVFLVSPDRQWVAIFSPPHQVEDLLTRYKSIRTFIDASKK
jgi:cytochrome oxidase Cu insertion factor (SCO1/SenC/PrrC family)